jgi:hypothetical protein
MPDGTEVDFSSKAAVERKMSLDELCMCFTHDRKRFEREFERAKADGCKIYLIVEDGNWEKTYNGGYQSKMLPQSLVASINAFRARYNIQLDFCKQETTGKLIKDILFREVKEYLEEMDDES